MTKEEYNKKQKMKYKCSKCKKESSVSYYNKETKEWECDKCCKYLKKEK